MHLALFVVVLASHTLLSLAALCVSAVAAEAMTLELRSLVPNTATPAELSRCEVVGHAAAALTE